LPEPILPALLKWSSVTVVGSELLGPVPLELLPFAGGRLEQRVAVSYLPSLPVGELLHRRAERRERGPGRDLVLIAAPALPPGAGPKRAPLPFDDGHLERLLRDLEPERARVFARHGATAAALSSGEVRAARSLAVIAHGERDDARERPTVFQLASDSGVASIGCNEVEELLVPPVVVLCVCHAARGPVRAGDGGAGDLGGAFLRAGAQAVLLAPWSIDYEDACELAGLVLEHLRRGDPPTRALNRARSSFLAGARGEDPSRAFLRVVGLGGRPVF
jgi:CHAT domain-containing protein